MIQLLSDSNPGQHGRQGCCPIRCSNRKALLAHLESIWNHWHPSKVPYSTNQYFIWAHSITNLLSNLMVRGGHCSWWWEAATVLDGERRPPWLIVRGNHNFYLLGWLWEAATIRFSHLLRFTTQNGIKPGSLFSPITLSTKSGGRL